MLSSYKFIQKFWLLSEQIINLSKIKSDKQNEELEVFTNQSINKINQALKKFRYNVIIATYHEIYSYYKKITENGKNYKNLKYSFQKIILTMIPVIPHLANECLEKLNYNKDINWPDVEQKYLNTETINIVIQINGKKRAIISVENDIQENEIINQIKNKQLIDKYVKNGKIVKTIYVKNRLINYIVKS